MFRMTIRRGRFTPFSSSTCRPHRELLDDQVGRLDPPRYHRRRLAWRPELLSTVKSPRTFTIRRNRPAPRPPGIDGDVRRPRQQDVGLPLLDETPEQP